MANPTTVGFEATIKPLFRAKDQESMSGKFDLWSYDDVRQNADAILARVRAGNMPCDQTWPSTQVELFQRWIEAGKLP